MVEAGAWRASLEAARDEGFTFFDWLSAVDRTYDEAAPGFDVTAHLLDVGTPGALRGILLVTRVADGAAARLGDRRLRRRRLARARDLRDVRHRLRRLRRRQRPADPPAAAARRLRGHPAAQVVPARRARLQALARRQGARRGPRVRASRPAAAACRRPASPRPSGARDEPARGDDPGAVGAGGLPRAAAARRADRAQGDGAHAGPARPDVRRRLPRLGAARRRRREVRAEGGHHPAGRRPVGLPARPRGGADPVPRRARDHPDRPGRRRDRRARLGRARARRHLGGRPRHADGGLGQRQQVRPARWPARRRPAGVVRAADRARRRVDGPGRRLAVAAHAHRPLVAVVDAVAAAGRGRLPRRRRRRAAAPAVRHAGRRRRARHGRVDRVHRPAVRLLPARRVRRHRRDVAAVRHALAGRLARPVRGHPGLAVDPAQGVRRGRASSSGCASPGPGCARTSCSGWPGCGSCRSPSSS